MTHGLHIYALLACAFYKRSPVRTCVLLRRPLPLLSTHMQLWAEDVQIGQPVIQAILRMG